MPVYAPWELIHAMQERLWTLVEYALYSVLGVAALGLVLGVIFGRKL